MTLLHITYKTIKYPHPTRGHKEAYSTREYAFFKSIIFTCHTNLTESHMKQRIGIKNPIVLDI